MKFSLNKILPEYSVVGSVAQLTSRRHPRCELKAHLKLSKLCLIRGGNAEKMSTGDT